jgi:hypothetical protein
VTVEVALRSRLESWGADADERAARYPCDALLAVADQTLFRAITVHAPPPVVFRWLCQLRVAPYSYDWIDNLGRRSPRRLVPGVEDLAVGQRFMTIFILTDFEPDRHLTLYTDHRLFGEIGCTYLVTPREAGARLVVKLQIRYRRTPTGLILRRVLPIGDLVMMRKQLRTLRRLAEAQARAAGTGPVARS